MAKYDEALLIEKEEVANLHFPAEEVLTDKDAKKLRLAGLERGMKLGNIEHNKISLVFEDDEGLKKVETTVWGVTDKRVLLKQGLYIPINRVHSVN